MTTTKQETTIIPMTIASAYDYKNYGVLYRSTYVYRVAGHSSPTRVVIWGNTGRINPRNGEPVRYGDCGPIDGGNGKYLDPQNVATDNPVSILLSAESTVITNNGTNTGTAASGQVWDRDDVILRTGDILHLVSDDGAEITGTVRLTNNGHGRLDTTD